MQSGIKIQASAIIHDIAQCQSFVYPTRGFLFHAIKPSMSNSTDSGRIQPLLRFVGYTITTGFVGSIALVALVLQPSRPGYPLIGAWFVLHALNLLALCLAVVKSSRLAPADGLSIGTGARRHILLSGCVWGLASFLFIPILPTAYQAPFTMILLGANLTSIPLVPDVRGISLLLLPTWLPAAYAFYIANGSWAAAVAIFCMLCCVYLAADVIRTMLDDATTVRLERDKAVRELSEVNALQRSFFLTAKHDFRQPLQAISLYTIAIKQASMARIPELEGMFGKLEETCENLQNLIDERFSLAKISIKHSSRTIGRAPAAEPVEPALARMLELTAAREKSPAIRSRETHLGTHTIAIVDDDRHIRESLAMMLSGAGATVISAADREELFNALGDCDDLSLLLTDLHLAHERGSDLADEVRVRFPAAKVIILTGDGSQETQAELSHRDFTILLKPISSTILLDKISIVLDIVYGSADRTQRRYA
jgi:CheY-like chemotaxis protein